VWSRLFQRGIPDLGEIRPILRLSKRGLLPSLAAILDARPLFSALPSMLPNVPFEQLQSSDEPLRT